MRKRFKHIFVSFVWCLIAIIGPAQKSDHTSVTSSATMLPPCDQLELPDSLFVCAGESIQLVADLSQFESYAGLQWTGGNGAYIPSDTVAQPIYIPTAQETAAGFVNLTLQVFTSAISQPGGSFLAYDHNGEDIIFYTNTQDGSVDIIQSNTGNDWTAMGFRTSDNMLFGISNIVTTPTLSSVNIETGVVTPIFTYFTHQFYAGDYDNVNDIFYAVGIDEDNTGQPVDQLLYTIDLNTGSLDTIGNLNLPATDNFFYAIEDGINGLAYDPSLEVLWATTTSGMLLEINPISAAINSTVSTITELRGLAYDYNEQELWGISATGTLYHINKFTGELIEEVLCQEQLFYVTSLTYALPQNLLDNICTASTSIIIQNGIAPDLGDDIITCSDEPVTLMAPGYVTYLWQDGSAGSTYTVTSSGSYSVVVTDSFGCISSDEINITMNETPAAGFSATPPAITAADTEVTFSAINPDEGLAYAWSFESGTPQASDALNPVVNFTSIPGNYEVMLVVSNTIGCADTAYYTIYIESDGQISLPNIFTPNGDGDNDRFIPFQDYPGNWKLTIFNRWGTAIFETTNLLQGWTGEGHTAGTYYWILNPSAGQSGTRKSGYVMMVKEEN